MSRARAGDSRRKRWIGIDGEGIGRNPHRYVQLVAADRSGWNDYIEDVNGISTVDALNFLLSLPKLANLAGYYLGYDWTMILRDLPDRSLYRLFRPELRALPNGEGGGFSHVRFRGYRLHWLSGAMTIKKDGERRVIWDLGKYYQKPFVEAIEDSGIDGALEMVKRMKAERGSWNDDDLDRMLAYCKEECIMLAKLATKLAAQHDKVGVTPRSWYGPGSSASVVLRRESIHKRRGTVPSEVLAAADKAFFGGRFEHSTVGRVPGVWGYDITSAYPAATVNLPCLEHGKWRHTSDESTVFQEDISHACVRFRVADIGERVWAPLPCRLSDGNIVFARGGFTGHVWRDEWQAAKDDWTGLLFLDAWTLERCCDCRPFEWLRDIFEARKRGDIDEKTIYKLIINSVYGKLAQRIGDPPFASTVWAGMITSWTRAELLKMISRHRDEHNVIALATDGAYSRERIAVPNTKELGTWGGENHGAMWFVRPGIYWSEKDETLRARGLGRKQLREQIKAVKRGIREGVEKIDAGTMQAFGAAKMTVYKTQSGVLKRSPLYGQWYERPASISLTPLPKRNPDWSLRRLDNVTSRGYAEGKASLEARVLKLLGELFEGRK